jgi:hypothetical protein
MSVSHFLLTLLVLADIALAGYGILLLARRAR